MKNLYHLLGVNPDASIDEIKTAYRKLSQKWHPDVNTSEEATAKFAEIAGAFKLLSNPETRHGYDEKLSKGVVEDIDAAIKQVVEEYLESLVRQ
ncbi:MAG TPA: J domain-containing protein [Candidatus Paceibacterota bacterium]